MVRKGSPVRTREEARAEADRLPVLDGGRLVESGSHAELVGAGGVYQLLWGRFRDEMVDVTTGTSR